MLHIWLRKTDNYVIGVKSTKVKKTNKQTNTLPSETEFILTVVRDCC